MHARLTQDVQYDDPAAFVPILQVQISNLAGSHLRYAAYVAFATDGGGPRFARFRIRDSVSGTIAGSSESVNIPITGGQATVAMVAQVDGNPAALRTVTLEVAVGGGVGTIFIRAATNEDAEGATLIVDEYVP